MIRVSIIKVCIKSYNIVDSRGGEGRGGEGRGGEGRGGGEGGEGRGGERAGQGGEGRGLSTLSTNQNICDRGA